MICLFPYRISSFQAPSDLLQSTTEIQPGLRRSKLHCPMALIAMSFLELRTVRAAPDLRE